MRISVTSGDRTVYIKIKGRTPELLAQAEATDLRLLAATPEPPAQQPFGFTLGAETDAAEQEQALELGGDTWPHQVATTGA